MSSPDPLVPISAQFKTTEETTLLLSENLIKPVSGFASVKYANSDDDDQQGEVFKVEAVPLSPSSHRKLMDSNNGNIMVGQTFRKLPSPLIAYVGSVEDDKLCTVTVDGALNPTKCNAKIHMRDQEIGSASGNWNARELKIIIGDTEVATIHKKKKFVVLGNYFEMVIASGVDMAFIVLLVLALEELYSTKMDAPSKLMPKPPMPGSN